MSTPKRSLEPIEYAILTGMIVAGLIAVVVAIDTWAKNESRPPLKPPAVTSETK